MSKFTPISEADYKARNCWPVGYYSAEITESVEKLSKAGNMMYEVKFQVFNDDGKMKLITTYLLAEGDAAWKLRACAEAFGFLDEYRSGDLSENDMNGKSGYVKVGIESDASGVYEDKNTIVGFKKTLPGKVEAVTKPKPKTKKETEEELDDVIKF